MKTKTTRLALLRSRFRALNTSGALAVASLAAFAASRQIDAKDHARRSRAFVTQTARSMDSETRDEAEITDLLSPAFAKVERAAESEALNGELSTLNAAERRQLARELPAARSVIFALAPVVSMDAPLTDAEIAALPAVEDFAPVASLALLAEVDAEIAAEGAFLADVAALPLRLTA